MHQQECSSREFRDVYDKEIKHRVGEINYSEPQATTVPLPETKSIGRKKRPAARLYVPPHRKTYASSEDTPQDRESPEISVPSVNDNGNRSKRSRNGLIDEEKEEAPLLTEFQSITLPVDTENGLKKRRAAPIYVPPHKKTGNCSKVKEGSKSAELQEQLVEKINNDLIEEPCVMDVNKQTFSSSYADANSNNVSEETRPVTDLTPKERIASTGELFWLELEHNGQVYRILVKQGDSPVRVTKILSQQSGISDAQASKLRARVENEIFGRISA